MMTSPRPLSRMQAHCNSSMPRGFAGTFDVRLALGELPINVASKRTYTGAKLYGDHAVCKRSKTADDEIPSEPVPAIDGREEALLDTLDDSSTTRSLTPPPLQMTPDNIAGLLVTRPTVSIPLHHHLPEVEAHVKTLKVRLGMAMFKLRKHKADVHYRAVVAARLPQLASIGARTKQPKHWGAISCGLGERREHDNRGSQWTNFSESPQLTNDNAQVKHTPHD